MLSTIVLRYHTTIKQKNMVKQNLQCTLDVDSSSSDSDTNSENTSLDTQNEKNNIEEIDDDDVKILDASSYIIPTQLAVIIPSPLAPSKHATTPSDKPSDSLIDLAVKIKSGVGSSLSASDRAWADKQSRLKPNYSSSLDRNEVRFFEIIKEHGTDELKKILEVVDDRLEFTRVFYIKLKGERSGAKCVILNECLTLSAMK